MRDIPTKLNKYVRFYEAVDRHFYMIKTWRFTKTIGTVDGAAMLGKYRDIIRNEYTVIILGKPGPTGKTWLTTKLLEQGYRAIEISEIPAIYRNVRFDDCNDEDYFEIDDNKKVVIVILNEPVIRFDRKIHYEKGEK